MLIWECDANCNTLAVVFVSVNLAVPVAFCTYAFAVGDVLLKMSLKLLVVSASAATAAVVS